MKIGSYGGVVFQVTDKVAETFRDMQFSSAANYAEHAVHGGDAVREFTGFPNDRISFSIILSAFQGVNPDREINNLLKMMKSKKSYVLVIGQRIYGDWTLEALSNDIQYTYKDGTCVQCETGLTLYGKVKI